MTGLASRLRRGNTAKYLETAKIPPLAGRALRDAAIIVAVLIAVARAAGVLWPDAIDFHAYYVADLGSLYAGSYSGGPDAFLYSPLFAQLTEPLRWLPYTVALGLWTALELGALIYLAGPWSLPLMLLLSQEWMLGNVHIIMAAAVVVGMKQPAAWSFPLMTKLSPGVGILWFAVRREWRPLAVAVGTFAALAAVSFALAPGLWFDWARLLVANVGPGSSPEFLGGHLRIPLLWRLPAAVLLVVWGARTGRAWTVPVACGLAMPVLWISAVIAFGLAAIRSRRSGERIA